VLDSKQLGDRSAKPAGKVMFLGGNDRTRLGGRSKDRFAVERLDRVHVDHSRADTLLA
jgi:hypothetical protein